MAYPIFIIIGLVFDLLVLAASCALIYMALDPSLLDLLADSLAGVLEYGSTGRMEIFFIGVVFLVLSLRGIFLLIFGRGSPEVVVSQGQAGSVSISHASLEHILRKLVEMSGSGASLKAAAAAPAGTGAISIRLRVRLDLVGANLAECSKEIEQRIRAHFKEKLGLEVKSFRLRAEYSADAAPRGDVGGVAQ